MVETVTIGDQEVEIRETEDGFEAVASDESPPYIQLGMDTQSYGAVLPFGAKMAVSKDDEGGYIGAWDSDDAIVNGETRGYSGAKSDDPDLDAYASLGTVKIVQDTSGFE